MQATVERVDKFRLMINGDWKNLSKFHKNVNLDGIKAGDEVEIELAKDKFITSLRLVSSKSTMTYPVTGDGEYVAPTVSNKPQSKQTEVAMSVATKAVYPEVFIKLLASQDYSEAVSSSNQLIKLLAKNILLVNPTLEETNGTNIGN